MTNEEKKEIREKPEPFFYCKFGGIEPLCSDCKRNHLNSEFSTEEISNWYQPRANASRKRCRDYIKLLIMTNEEKAKEIAENKFSWYSDFEDVNSFEECYESAMAMAKWKDEQHPKDNLVDIDKACEWIKDNYFEYLQPISYHEQLQNSIDINDFVNNLKKSMEEQL